MTFNPDEYLNSNNSSVTFDPDSYLNNTQVPNQAFLPGINRVKKLLSTRKDSVQTLKEEMAYKPNPLQHPIDYAMQPLVKGIKALGVPYQRIESTVAAPALAIQAGNPKDIVKSLLGGISGKNQSQLGDLIRTTGFGGKNNELLASTTGLLGIAGLGNLATKGNIAPNVIGKSPSKIASQAGQELSNIGSTIKSGVKNIKDFTTNFNNKLLRSGLSKKEVTRIQQTYGNSNATLVDKAKSLLNDKSVQADSAYSSAVNNFKGNTINSEPLFKNIQRGLREKGWIDLQGNPTTRFKSGLDPVIDKMTNMYLDLKNTPTNAGSKVLGNIISKEDFSTYRDALGNMLKEKPSDRLVMSARNALYDSAEKSGMTGIKKARDLEKVSYEMQSKFLNRNTGDLKIANEQKLSRIGTDKPLSKQELDHIRELEVYIGHPIVKDARNINKVNKALEKIKNIKKYAIGAAVGALGMSGIGKVHKIATGN